MLRIELHPTRSVGAWTGHNSGCYVAWPRGNTVSFASGWVSRKIGCLYRCSSAQSHALLALLRDSERRVDGQQPVGSPPNRLLDGSDRRTFQF